MGVGGVDEWVAWLGQPRLGCRACLLLWLALPRLAFPPCLGLVWVASGRIKRRKAGWGGAWRGEAGLGRPWRGEAGLGGWGGVVWGGVVWDGRGGGGGGVSWGGVGWGRVGMGGAGRGEVGVGWAGVGWAGGRSRMRPPPTPVPAAPHTIGLPSHTAISPSIDPTNAQPRSLRPLGRCKCAAGWPVAWLLGWLLGWLADWSVFGGLARRLTGCCFAGRVFGWPDEAVSRKHAPWRAGLCLVVSSAS